MYSCRTPFTCIHQCQAPFTYLHPAQARFTRLHPGQGPILSLTHTRTILHVLDPLQARGNHPLLPQDQPRDDTHPTPALHRSPGPGSGPSLSEEEEEDDDDEDEEEEFPNEEPDEEEAEDDEEEEAAEALSVASESQPRWAARSRT